jgi:hypothetical protein
LWYRVLVGLWSLWLVTALSEPAALHVCPAHGGHMAHGGSMSMRMAHGPATGAPGDHHDNSKCTCLGACCCTGTLAVATTRVSPLADVVAPAPLAAPLATARPRTLVAHSHPFAHAPPALLEAFVG